MWYLELGLTLSAHVNNFSDWVDAYHCARNVLPRVLSLSHSRRRSPPFSTAHPHRRSPTTGASPPPPPPRHQAEGVIGVAAVSFPMLRSRQLQSLPRFLRFDSVSMALYCLVVITILVPLGGARMHVKRRKIRSPVRD